MARGKQELEAKECEQYSCSNALPTLRHPRHIFCSIKCRNASRWERKHIVGKEFIECLDCGRKFVKVGAHAVMAHGYDTAKDYRIAHGLDYKRGTITSEHAQRLASSVKENGTIDNLKNGAKHRFKQGDGKASKVVKHYWHYKKTGLYDEGENTLKQAG